MSTISGYLYESIHDLKNAHTKNINTNEPDVIAPVNYNEAIQEANKFLLSGEKKKALEAFKNSVSGDKIKIQDLENAAAQTILPELTLSEN